MYPAEVLLLLALQYTVNPEVRYPLLPLLQFDSTRQSYFPAASEFSAIEFVLLPAVDDHVPELLSL